MITENLSTLKIHKLSQEQYERELANGTLDPNALYLTPDEEVDLRNYVTVEQLDNKADKSHSHNDIYYTESEIDTKLSSKANSTHNHDSAYDAKGSASAVQENLDTVSDTLDTHTENADIHVTTTNKSNWNSAYTHSTSAHARTDATKVADSTTNGNILINGTETNVYSHPNSGVTAGTYKSVTVNAQGHITAGTNPTTLAGYGITDAESKGAANSALASAKEYTDSVASGKADKTHNHDSAYDAKGAASSALASAKTYADSAATTAANAVKSALLNGAGEAYDTLKELADLITDNQDAIDALETVASGKADKSHSHAISDVSGLQSALDGKAASSHGTHVSYSTTAPVMDGTASVGTASTVARSDHKHPTDTSRAAKADLDSHTSNTTAHITSTERSNWNAAKTHADSAHAPSNAEKNQNAFSNITVGSTTVAADTATDTVTFVGSNVTITPDATNDKITFAVADGSTSAKGIVQLTNSTSSTSTTTAATPSSVKSAYDLANTAKTNAATAQTKADSAYALAEGKVDSLSDLGVTATATELNYVDGVTSAIQTQLDGKAASSHTHNYAGSSSAGGAATSANKVNKSLTVKLNGGTTEGTNLFTFNGSAAKSVNITPSAIGAAASSHTHDDRYYTESEIDSKITTLNTAISGKAASSHTHNYAGSSSAGGAATSASTIAVTNTTPTSATKYYQLYATGTSGNQTVRANSDLYYYDTGTASYFNVGSSTADSSNKGGITLHSGNGKYIDISPSAATANRSIALPDVNGTVITTGNLPSASDIGAAASSHTHDDRYYTESEIDTKLSGKANSSHGNHVPATQTASNKVFLRNDNTWQTVTPANIGAAPTSHASSATTYGVSTASNYGHAKATSTAPKAHALTAAVGSETSSFARGDHVHPMQVAIHGVTTGGTGAAYTATVEGITALSAGASFIMIPNVVSTSTAPTLNVNSLGAKTIRRRLSSATGSTAAGYNAAWLTASKPVRVTYDGTYWIADMVQLSAADISGTIAINKGGTGATTAAAALTNLGAAPAYTYSTTDLTAGTSSLTTGKMYLVYE